MNTCLILPNIGIVFAAFWPNINLMLTLFHDGEVFDKRNATMLLRLFSNYFTKKGKHWFVDAIITFRRRDEKL